MAKGSKAWSIMSLGAAVGSAAVAKKTLNTGWTKATGKTPPANPADPDVNVWEAVAWAAASGTFVNILKMLATRRAANYYLKSTGHLPAELQADGNKAPATGKGKRKKSKDSVSDDLGTIVGASVD
ncbi:hypothetical protein GCM10011584_24390 [Nocardioides phosphati]|uniref:DUF4235 domain-containing protein n=1 Tax=Nocardioides phosphati TaxID=1867775 RepID=A0ABQ2NC54_9ACTN|nr:DUF4235 domain-containing protein [Nocardioides phosphati]GGO91098.1 hypothetical protein GCM10011584_24390 [Nocardioides phosphati]